MMERMLIAGYLFFAVLFIAVMPMFPFAYSYIAKTIPIALLVALTAISSRRTIAVSFTLGFVFSAAGDITLELDRARYFIHGMAFFACAHIAYLSGFVRMRKLDLPGLVLTITAGGYVAYIASLIFANLGHLTIPVFMYMIIIFAMVASASFSGPLRPLALVGALLFTLSDSLIAYDKFVQHFASARTAIMATYYLGQLCIALGVMDAASRRRIFTFYSPG